MKANYLGVPVWLWVIVLAIIVWIIVSISKGQKTTNPKTDIGSNSDSASVTDTATGRKINGSYCCDKGGTLVGDMCKYFNGQTFYWISANVCATETPLEAINIKSNK